MTSSSWVSLDQAVHAKVDAPFVVYLLKQGFHVFAPLFSRLDELFEFTETLTDFLTFLLTLPAAIGLLLQVVHACLEILSICP